MSDISESSGRCCVVCGQSAAYSTLAELPFGKILRCSYCDVHSITPLPTVEQLIAAYQNFDAGEIARNEFNAYVEQAKDILKSDLASSSLNVDHELKFLDYGCGGGHFVKAASELGIAAWGIDLDEEDAKFGRIHGLRIAVGDFRNIDQLGPQTYNAILLMHVLEHVPHPADVLTALIARLEPNGVLIIRVPDQSSVPSTIKRCLRRLGIKTKEWGFVQPPVHLHGYSTKTFEIIARLHHLDVVRLSKISPLDHDEFPTTDRYWQNLAIHKQVYRLGRIAGSGGHLVAILRRQSL
ncbi:MAG: class I SAM-dependent methyltransferase [Hyphomicrobium sp.]